MSLPENDKLARLPHLSIPEPDPSRMQANIAASAELFARTHGHGGAAGHATGWLERLRGALQQFPGWMMPASAGALALVAAIAVAPTLMQPTLTQPTLEPPQLSRERAPAAPTDMMEAPIEMPRTMRMQPAPIGGQEAPVDITRYTFDGIELGLRNMPEAVELLLIRDGAEQALDFRIKDQGETFVLSDAFITGVQDTELLFVLIGPEDGQSWEAFERQGETYERMGELSALVGDAENRDEVLARLSNTAP